MYSREVMIELGTPIPKLRIEMEQRALWDILLTVVIKDKILWDLWVEYFNPLYRSGEQAWLLYHRSI